MALSENARLNLEHALNDLQAHKKAKREGRHKEAKYHADTVKLIYRSMRVNGWLR